MVLIAEDEENNFKFLEEFFAYMEIDILHAENGLKAVEIFRNYPSVDLILMDIKMPVMKGDKAAAEIKKLNNKVPS